jgi:hypothetical protein
MKRECLDHFLIFNQYQLKRIIVAFAEYYNQVKGKVIATPMLNGLHHNYAYASC